MQNQEDAIAMAAAIRTGQTTPAALLAEARARAQAITPLNAITDFFDPPPAGNGPLAGVPFLLKELSAAMAGHRLTDGSRYHARRISPADDALVTRLKAAGLQIFGRTNAPELGLRPVTESVLHGAARNPWDRTRTPGGSSGGAAAAVAAGVVPAAHGNDIGGSLRIPASCCGVFGYMPSRGRMPAGPLRLQTPGDMNTEGFITRSVRDNAALLDATMGADPALPGDPAPLDRPLLAEMGEAPGALRIAMVTGPMWARAVHPDSRAALEGAADLLRLLGHTVEEAEPLTPEEHRAAARAFLVMLSARIRLQTVDAAGPKGRALFEPATWAMGVIDRTHPTGAAAAALATQASVMATMAAFTVRYDALLTPVLAAPPLPIGATALKWHERLALGLLTRFPIPALAQATLSQIAGDTFAWSGFTPLFNMTGQPAMSVPLWWNAAGLPVGVQLAGQPGGDAALFRLAAQLERARPWAGRVPPL